MYIYIYIYIYTGPLDRPSETIIQLIPCPKHKSRA